MLVNLEELVTATDIAERTKMSHANHVHRLVRRPDFPREVGKVGKSRVWYLADVLAWLEQHSAKCQQCGQQILGAIQAVYCCSDCQIAFRVALEGEGIVEDYCRAINATNGRRCLMQAQDGRTLCGIHGRSSTVRVSRHVTKMHQDGHSCVCGWKSEHPHERSSDHLRGVTD